MCMFMCMCVCVHVYAVSSAWRVRRGDCTPVAASRRFGPGCLLCRLVHSCFVDWPLGARHRQAQSATGAHAAGDQRSPAAQRLHPGVVGVP